jgi:MFS family permease
MVDVVLVYLVCDTLHAGGVWYGVAEASWMAGMVAGSVGGGRVGTERGQVRATLAGAALACAGLAGFAVAPVVGVLVPLSVLGGVGNGYAGACLSTLLMARTPDSARGRVSATANAVLGGAQGASLLLGGVVAVALSLGPSTPLRACSGWLAPESSPSRVPPGPLSDDPAGRGQAEAARAPANVTIRPCRSS